MLVINKRTNQVEEFDLFVHYMDDDIRERTAWELAPCTEQEFINRYVELHYETYAEEFQVS